MTEILSKVNIDKEIIRYKGEVREGVRHGTGNYVYPEGGQGLYSYKGNWNIGRKVDTNGRFVMKGVFEHVGEFRDGEISGYGERKWSDGRTYCGDWLFGEMNGQGKWTSALQDEEFIGNFLSNQRQGVGSLRKQSSDNNKKIFYEGEFSKHKMNGNGKYSIENVIEIKGNFLDNVNNGYSEISWQNNNCQYAGNVSNGVLNDSNCLFKSLDGSYLYRGGVSNGLIDENATSAYLWTSLDRSKVKPKVAAAVVESNDKKKAPPAAVKKGAAAAVDASANLLVLSPGDELGVIVIKAGSGEGLATATAAAAAALAAVAVPAKGSKTATAVSVAATTPEPFKLTSFPEPDLHAVVAERRRRCVVRIRQQPPSSASSASSNPVGGDAYSFPLLPFWLKNKSLSEFLFDPARFPADAIHVKHGIYSVEDTPKALRSTLPSVKVTNKNVEITSSSYESDDIENNNALSNLFSFRYGGDKSLEINVGIENDFNSNSNINSSNNSSSNTDFGKKMSDFSSSGMSIIIDFVIDDTLISEIVNGSENNSELEKSKKFLELTLLTWHKKSNFTSTIDVEDDSSMNEDEESPSSLNNSYSLVALIPISLESSDFKPTATLFTPESNRCYLEVRNISTLTCCGKWKCCDLSNGWHSLAVVFQKETTYGNRFDASLNIAVDGVQAEKLSNDAEDEDLNLIPGFLDFSDTHLAAEFSEKSFGGFICQISFLSLRDGCDALEATSCFTKYQSTKTSSNMEASNHQSSDATSHATAAPAGYSIVTEASVGLVCGFGQLAGIVIPNDSLTSSSMLNGASFLVEVSDNVNERCLQPVTTSNISAITSTAPAGAGEDSITAAGAASKAMDIEGGDVGNMCCIVRPLEINKTISFKLETK